MNSDRIRVAALSVAGAVAKTMTMAAVVLAVAGIGGGISGGVLGQQPRFLSLTPPEGLPVIPVLEGWVAYPDGSRGFSYGVINRNEEGIDIPLGDGNYVEPAAYHGFQPTHFPPGRSTGVFYIVVPAEDAAIDVWWHLQTGSSEALKVPGRASQSAYELDFVRPRPQGALQPLAAFSTDGANDESADDGALAAGLMAGISERPRPVQAGQEVTLSVRARDPSDRDPSDPRFGEPLDMGVMFNKYQGPGAVEFIRSPDAPEPENPYAEDDPRHPFWTPPGANEAVISGGAGSVSVNAVFSLPGEYLIHAKIDNFEAPDSSNGDQCCWTNIYQRVQVTD